MVDGDVDGSLFQSARGKNVIDIDGSFDSTISGGSGADSVLITAGATETVTGEFTLGAGNDTVSIDQANGFAKGTYKLGAGDDQLILADTFEGTAYLGEGNDTITIADVATDSLVQTASGKNIIGFEETSNTSVVAGSGADSIDATAAFAKVSSTVDLVRTLWIWGQLLLTLRSSSVPTMTPSSLETLPMA